uniref:Uncharacterized protein n=1 Tax=Zea mays TaxID=4577 RepID=A0A804MS23_MAIZE
METRKPLPSPCHHRPRRKGAPPPSKPQIWPSSAGSGAPARPASSSEEEAAPVGGNPSSSSEASSRKPNSGCCPGAGASASVASSKLAISSYRLRMTDARSSTAAMSVSSSSMSSRSCGRNLLASACEPFSPQPPAPAWGFTQKSLVRAAAQSMPPSAKKERSASTLLPNKKPSRRRGQVQEKIPLQETNN